MTAVNNNFHIVHYAFADKGHPTTTPTWLCANGFKASWWLPRLSSLLPTCKPRQKITSPVIPLQHIEGGPIELYRVVFVPKGRGDVVSGSTSPLPSPAANESKPPHSQTGGYSSIVYIENCTGLVAVPTQVQQYADNVRFVGGKASGSVRVFSDFSGEYTLADDGDFDAADQDGTADYRQQETDGGDGTAEVKTCFGVSHDFDVDTRSFAVSCSTGLYETMEQWIAMGKVVGIEVSLRLCAEGSSVSSIAQAVAGGAAASLKALGRKGSGLASAASRSNEGGRGEGGKSTPKATTTALGMMSSVGKYWKDFQALADKDDEKKKEDNIVAVAEEVPATDGGRERRAVAEGENIPTENSKTAQQGTEVSANSGTSLVGGVTSSLWSVRSIMSQLVEDDRPAARGQPGSGGAPADAKTGAETSSRRKREKRDQRGSVTGVSSEVPTEKEKTVSKKEKKKTLGTVTKAQKTAPRPSLSEFIPSGTALVADEPDVGDEAQMTQLTTDATKPEPATESTDTALIDSAVQDTSVPEEQAPGVDVGVESVNRRDDAWDAIGRMEDDDDVLSSTERDDTLQEETAEDHQSVPTQVTKTDIDADKPRYVQTSSPAAVNDGDTTTAASLKNSSPGHLPLSETVESEISEKDEDSEHTSDDAGNDESNATTSDDEDEQRVGWDPAMEWDALFGTILGISRARRDHVVALLGDKSICLKLAASLQSDPAVAEQREVMLKADPTGEQIIAALDMYGDVLVEKRYRLVPEVLSEAAFWFNLCNNLRYFFRFVHEKQYGVSHDASGVSPLTKQRSMTFSACLREFLQLEFAASGDAVLTVVGSVKDKEERSLRQQARIRVVQDAATHDAGTIEKIVEELCAVTRLATSAAQNRIDGVGDGNGLLDDGAGFGSIGDLEADRDVASPLMTPSAKRATSTAQEKCGLLAEIKARWERDVSQLESEMTALEAEQKAVESQQRDGGESIDGVLLLDALRMCHGRATEVIRRVTGVIVVADALVGHLGAMTGSSA